MQKNNISNHKNHPKAYIKTFGCQMNVNDSEYLFGQLKHLNYLITDNISDADLILLNSCCVRKNVEQKIYSLIGKIRKLKINNPDIKLGLCGCLAQKEKENIFKNTPSVDFLLGPSRINELEELIKKIEINNKKYLYCSHLPEFTLKNIPIKRNSHITALVQIMRGCNNYCSYCIVPYTRGPEQSREVGELLSEVKNLIKKGYKEIFLLGQNVNSYGQDFKKPVPFSELLKMIAKIDNIKRIRFMTSHPKDLSFDLIETIKNEKNICNHIHLPIQSGSDKVLSLMNRKYDTHRYKTIFNKIRNSIEKVSITTDIMVGFPGETDNDFNDTLTFFKEMEFDNMYSFLYSNRENTVSSLMPNQVPLSIKKERLWKLIDLQKIIATKINKRMEGQTVEVLVEGSSRKEIDGQLTGRTDTNKSVIFKGKKELKGNLVLVKVIESDAWTLFGELV
jgi:tRNA-2-methylthio-N6-dimethylallyladenosine synthase